jgi:hypothetical protein
LPSNKRAWGSSYRFEQAKRDQPHNKEDEVEWKSHKKNINWCKDYYRIDDSHPCYDHSVDNSSIDTDITSLIDKVAEPAKETQYDRTAGELQKSQDYGGDLVSTATIRHPRINWNLFSNG